MNARAIERALHLLDDGRSDFRIMAKRGRAVINTHGRSIPELVGRIQAMAAWDVYGCLNPAIPGPGKPAVSDITAVRRFMLDLDPVDGSRVQGVPGPGGSELLTWVDAWLRDNTPITNHGHTRIFTGRGYQLWIPIAETMETQRAAAGIRGLVRQLAESCGTRGGWRVDTTSGEISRIARLPGTTNHKTGLECQIMWTEDYPEISVEDLDRWAEPCYDAPVEQLPVPNNLEGILPAMAPWSRDFALFGADGRVTSRHGRGYSMVADLAKLGVPQDMARVMLSVACSRCIPPLDDSAWMERTINAHYT